MTNTGEYILALSVFIYLIAILTVAFLHKRRFSSKRTDILLSASAMLITLDMLLLVYYQVKHDFHYVYVYEHTSADLAPVYLVSALWSGQEGSFLLWAVINSWIGFIFWRKLDKLGSQKKLAFTSFAVINITIMMMALLSRPFRAMIYATSEGLGLNPALQDPWMTVHPPLVFIGYSSMAVLFSLGLGFGPEIKVRSRKAVLRQWAILGWLFLSMGIFTGCIWAYRALGWGGYWAWDPIENAALIPWLLLVGVSHEGRSSLKTGNRIKCMLPFVLAVFGTVLSRSGVLKGKSAHAYAMSSLNIPLLVFLAVLILVIFYCFLSKAKMDGTGRQHAGISIFFILNVSLYAFAALVLLGTILPLISGTSVAAEFFNYSALFFSIVLVILFIAQHYTRFKKDCFKVLFTSAIITAAISVGMKFTSLTWLLILWIFIIPLVLRAVDVLMIMPIHLIKIKNPSAAIAHIGIILLILGAITSTAFSEQSTILVDKGSMAGLSHGTMIDGVSLEQEKSIIIHTFSSDIIFSSADNRLASSALQAVNYTTRPLIWLFWVGGVLIILGSFGALMKRCDS